MFYKHPSKTEMKNCFTRRLGRHKRRTIAPPGLPESRNKEFLDHGQSRTELKNCCTRPPAHQKGERTYLPQRLKIQSCQAQKTFLVKPPGHRLTKIEEELFYPVSSRGNMRQEYVTLAFLGKKKNLYAMGPGSNSVLGRSLEHCS